MSNNYGVVTEQGYPVGQFGFKPITEQDKKSLEEAEAKKKQKAKEDEDKE